MGELPDQEQKNDFEAFVGRWLAPLVAVFLRAVGDPPLAFDLATETLAAVRLQREFSADDDEAVEWVLRFGAQVLEATVERGRVPAGERRRGREPAPRLLTVAEQREIMALAEEHIELPAAAGAAADVLARMAPPPHVLAQLRCSELVQAEPLPARDALLDHEPSQGGNQRGV